MPARRPVLLIAASTLALLAGSPLKAGTKTGTAGRAGAPRPSHRILFHVATDDVGAMSHAIGSADNAMKVYADRGEAVAIEIVANGAGVRMLRADTSPVAPSLAYLRKTYPGIVLSACGVTLALMRQREGTSIALLDGVAITPAGIVRITELQEQGWSYVRS